MMKHRNYKNRKNLEKQNKNIYSRRISTKKGRSVRRYDPQTVIKC